MTQNFLLELGVLFFGGLLLGAVVIWFVQPRRAEVEEMRIQLEDAFTSIDDGFVLFNKNDEIVICNEAFKEQFKGMGLNLGKGIAYEGFVLEMAKSGVIPGIEGKEQEFVDDLMAKRSSEFGLEKIFQTNEGRWIRQRDKKTSSGNVVGLRTDITQLKDNEFSLEKALDEAKSAEKAKSMFLASMSHEIRTPMNGILGMAEMLGEETLSDEQMELVQTIQSSGNALLQILNDILDFSKLDAGKLSLEQRPFDLRLVVRDSMKLLEALARQKKLSLELWVSDELPPWLLGDEGRLRQIVLNLVGNAIKFTNEGCVRIEVNAEIDKTQASVRIAVEDTGVGIPEAVQGRIFEQFEQAEDGTTRKFGGTGLGLSISRKLAQQMGGDITVRSIEGKGSCFTVESCFQVAQALEQSPTSSEPSSAEKELKGVKLLAAEDNRTNQLVLRKMLAASGVEFSIASDGNEAVGQFVKDRPDIILMDVSMPHKSGLEAAADIRTIEEASDLPPTPIIALTANAFAEDRKKCLAAGMDDFLSKPINKELLVTKIAEALHARDKAAAKGIRPPAKKESRMALGASG